MPIIAYLIFCIINGVLARKTTIGFWGFFFLSLILTPLVGFAIFIITTSRRDRHLHNAEM